MLNFVFLEKGPGIVSPPYFQNVSHAFFLSFIWPNFVVWLPLLLEIFGKMCMAITCFPGIDVKNFEINLMFPAVSPHDQKFKTKI